MSSAMSRKRDIDKVADLIRDAGGRVVGRTRLQKVSYLLELAGVGDGFSFEYRHYGPYSEELAQAAEIAASFGLIREEEYAASWGGLYSVYTTSAAPSAPKELPRLQLARAAVSADPIELELAAAAAFLAAAGESDPWAETAKRKAEKAQQGRLEKAKALYRKLQLVETPRRLPAIRDK